MLVAWVIVVLSIGCFLDLRSFYINFDNEKFRNNLLLQCVIKGATVALLSTYLASKG